MNRQVMNLLRHPGRLYRNVRYRFPASSSPRDHVFIVGVPRSGTTLLKSILVAHPDFGGSDYESTGIFNLRDIFSYGMGEIPPAEMAELLERSPDIVRFYDAVVSRLLEKLSKKRFVDKLQARATRFRYARDHFPNATFVHIVRDARDCYCSARKHPNVPQGKSARGFATYWSESLKLPERCFPESRLITIRYEDMTASPESVLGGLMERIGSYFSPAQIDSSVIASTTSIKKREVHRNLAKPINTSSQGRWMRELTAEEQQIFLDIAGEGLARYGYSTAPPSALADAGTSAGAPEPRGSSTEISSNR